MAVTRWKGPDVLVIGWIPFHLNPPVAAGYPPGLASTLLFQSGNPNPPIAFRGYLGFANWSYPLFLVGSREYRAAVYLEGVAAEFPDDGSPPRADRTANGIFPGYTPYRMFTGGVNTAALIPLLPQYGSGYGPAYQPVSVPDPARSWVELRYRAEFKLSRLPNLLSRMLTNTCAPYAWCEIVYRFDKSGQIAVRVDGSAVPNRWLYIDWAVPQANPAGGIVPEYDMLTATPANVVGFLQTTGWGCRPAPADPASQLTWSGQAVAL
ncbi:MAG TPA: hypothetical protein VMG10_22980 [Gemmataceae bacterium]|nr:hypothetical protein [Gemmataceae bacterium]